MREPENRSNRAKDDERLRVQIQRAYDENLGVYGAVAGLT